MLTLAGCSQIFGGDRPPSPGGLSFPEGVLYQDDFEEARDLWDEGDDGIVSYIIDEGQLIVTIDDINASAWSPLNFTFDDYVLEVDTIQLAGPDDNGFGILFRYQDAENYYRFDITSDGFYALSKTVEGVFEGVSEWNVNPAIHIGAQSNRMRIEATGSTFRFAVNDTILPLCVGPEQPIWDPANPETCLGGEVVDTWTDGALARGQIALGATAYREQGPSIGFDNLVIREVVAAP